MLEQVQVAMLWRVARQAYNLEDIDILEPGALNNYVAAKSGRIATGANALPVQPGGFKQLGIQKVKVSQIADQLDDTELELIGKPEIDAAYLQYRSVRGAEPAKEAEPSVEQITVLHNKVVSRVHRMLTLPCGYLTVEGLQNP